MAAATLVSSKLQMNYKPARDPATTLSNLEEVALLEYSFGDTGLQIELKASPQEPIYLLEVGHLTLEAFGDGGTPAVEVGDGSDADYYLAGLADDAVGDRAVSTKGGKLTARSVIKLTLTDIATTGKGLLWAKFVRA